VAEYRSAASPLDRLLADPAADDKALWFGDLPGATTRQIFTGPPVEAGNSGPAGHAPPPAPIGTMATVHAPALAAIAAGVRCCIPPDADTDHTPLCPVYGFPPPSPTTPAVSIEVAALNPVYGFPPPVTAAAGKCERCPEFGMCDACQELDWVVDAQDGDDRPPVQWPWGALATWGDAADERVTVTTDGYLWCKAGTSACKYPTDARLQPVDNHTPVADLIVWLARHWGCTDA
jgi:hypothetical protein